MNEVLALDLIRELCCELNARRINYCHWKSNAALTKSACGENDLDFLIGRPDTQNFIEILTRLGFKYASEPFAYRMPGVQDYYGYDPGTGRLIHVHAHYQLILGHDATKNYHLPIEKAYLESVCQNGWFKVPAAEFELILLVIRLMLKHSTWDTMLLHQGKISISERGELDYLLKQVSLPGVYKILHAHLPFIGDNLFENCLNSLQEDCPSWNRALAGQKLVNCLETYARRTHFIDAGLKFWRRIAWPVQKRVFRSMGQKQLGCGGVMMAIVGGDGAGKTTLVGELCHWLSEDFEVTRFHLGKPKWSFLTILVRGILKVGRSLGLYPFIQAEIRFTHEKEKIVFPGYPYLIREVLTARDRYITYQRAQRIATNGGMVIIDRFPLRQIKFMDGPQIDWLTSNYPSNRWIRLLSRLEKHYYQKILLPYVLIILLVDPEVAVQRKTDETGESVRARSSEIWDQDWRETTAYLINANNSKEKVLTEVKSLVWSLL
jgi:thymidylate kinase